MTEVSCSSLEKKKMEITIILSIFSLLLVSLHLVKKRLSVKSKQLPGPSGLPIIGNLHQYDSAKPHEFLWKLSRRYGPLMQLKLGYRPVLVISSAKAAKEALKTHDLVFSGRPSLIGQQKLSYNGRDLVFSPYDEYNKEMKKIFAVHLFSFKRAQSFRPIRGEEISLAMKKISMLSSDSQVIDLSSMMINLTITFICRVAFGKNFDKRRQQRKRLDEILEGGQALFAGFFFSDYIPWLSWIDRISGMQNRLEKSFKDFDSFYKELIDEHLDPKRPETMKGDVLDFLIGMKKEQLPSGFDLTWDHIKALLMDIFIGGTDATAASIVWAMTALMKKPCAIKRVQTEIRENVEGKDIVDEGDLQNLSYLKAVVKETMRLYPPVPLIPRETIEKCIIEGYDIRAKTLVFVNEWAIARDPECWENSEEFEPERFLNSNIDVKGNDFEVIPFGAGRRICPGVSMGLAMVELALANLLYLFDWELPSGMKIEDIDTDVLTGLTMHKKNALCLVATIKHQLKLK